MHANVKIYYAFIFLARNTIQENDLSPGKWYCSVTLYLLGAFSLMNNNNLSSNGLINGLLFSPGVIWVSLVWSVMGVTNIATMVTAVVMCRVMKWEHGKQRKSIARSKS